MFFVGLGEFLFFWVILEELVGYQKDKVIFEVYWEINECFIREMGFKEVLEKWFVLDFVFLIVFRQVEIFIMKELGGCYQDVDCDLSIKNKVNFWKQRMDLYLFVLICMIKYYRLCDLSSKDVFFFRFDIWD